MGQVPHDWALGKLIQFLAGLDGSKMEAQHVEREVGGPKSLAHGQKVPFLLGLQVFVVLRDSQIAGGWQWVLSFAGSL